MSDVATAARGPRRFGRWLAIVLVVAALLLVAIAWISRPQRATSLMLDVVGRSLGLQVSADSGTYRLRGTPQLDVHGVIVREPGAARPILHADRVVLSLPWSTIRARGNDLVIDRIELERPVIDLPALQHWLQQRPAAEARIPTLTRGLRIRDGSVAGAGWSIAGLAFDIPRLAPAKPVSAAVSGRFSSGAYAIPFALQAALLQPASDTAFGISGSAAIQARAWRMPTRLRLSGRLHPLPAGWSVQRMKFGVAARYESGATHVPIAFGVGGNLLQSGAQWRLSPAALATVGQDIVPALAARGRIAFAGKLDLDLAGQIQGWPKAWPALPPPLSQSGAPLPFALSYSGAPALTDIATLRLRRDQAIFDGRFRPLRIADWIVANADSPLPPLDGQLSAPRLDIAGARLDGVELSFDDPDVAPAPKP
jgi:hypothetical protein